MKDHTVAQSDREFRKMPDPDTALRAAIISRLEDGNIAAAIRILRSDDSVAPVTARYTLTALCEANVYQQP